jgi:hypothetical protein
MYIINKDGTPKLDPETNQQLFKKPTMPEWRDMELFKGVMLILEHDREKMK